MELLLRVEHTFKVPSRGCVISAADLCASCRVGDEIMLRTPTGRELHTRIKAVEMLKTLEAPRTRPAIVLPEEIKKEDIRPGTEVWLTQPMAPKETASS